MSHVANFEHNSIDFETLEDVLKTLNISFGA